MIDDNPLIFTGTLRDNLDPFRKYSNAQLVEALVSVGLWDEIPFHNPVNY